ncbi:hypothetical protein RHS04_08997 [Rhizoctonia solani]|uniref:Zn(2)-C6 fungal-type domain-containing protein n=1 Tax=Rhizoctonia solani TaxID=456999 RepID=A0A8H7H125_9AGAM|nr:hypothetical protein RHS04_08997 [Rhizoctonia solani]
MQDAGGHSCKNCLERGKVCDRAEPICNLCIRDGLFCSGPDPPIRAPSPVFPSWEPPDLLRPFDRSLNSAPRVLRGAVSAIVSTPSWGASNVRFVDKIAFKMPPPELREGIILRLRSSVITFSVMSLGARIIQALIDNFDDTNWTVYSNLTDRLYSHICAVSNNADDQSHIEGRLAGTIDLAGFKFMTSNNAAGYELIQKATPTLLRLAYRHPEIWTKSGLISISQVIHGIGDLNFPTLRHHRASKSFTVSDGMDLGVSPGVCHSMRTNKQITVFRGRSKWLEPVEGHREGVDGVGTRVGIDE